MPELADLLATQRARRAPGSRGLRVGGRMVAAGGLVARVRGLEVALGEMVEFCPRDGGAGVHGEVVGFHGDQALVMPHGGLEGFGVSTAVFPLRTRLRVPVGDAVLGRVLGGTGEPVDGRGPLGPAVPRRPLVSDAAALTPRAGITEPLELGVRAVDGLLTCARGGRIGLFAAAGVGKSTLLGMIARRARATAVVVCLVGERRREVQEFVDAVQEGGAGSRVFVVSTAADPVVVRARAPLVAMTVAEGLRDEGHDVLFLMDSLTRYAQALRELGLARGESPAARGYPPSALAALAPLLERAGPGARGSITGLYTVLVEGDDHDEPVADTARSYLDGHVELSRELARAGVLPAIDPARSVSRLMDRVVDAEQVARAREFRGLWAAYEEARDLLAVGAYRPGADPRVDRAVALRNQMEAFLRQAPGEGTGIEAARQALAEVLESGPEVRNE